MAKLSGASLELARTRPRAQPPPSCPLAPDWMPPSYPRESSQHSEYRECKRCQGAPCGYCDQIVPFGDE